MIVHTPTLTKDSGEICIASRIEMDKPLPYLPKKLWYRFNEKHEDRLSPRSDGFAATALLVAMYAGEDIRIRGSISPKLAYGLYDYRNVFNTWNPKLFKKVEIQFDQLDVVPQIPSQRGVMTAFSGGVDSFYTLWSHLPENQEIPDARVSHGLFIHGLDLRLDDKRNYQAVANKYTDLFESLGLELILGSTNAYQFSEFRIDWIYFYGAPMIGAALQLSPFLRRFYIPSGYAAFNKLVPNGISPLTDHLQNTEALEMIHHGAASTRYDKVAVLKDWPVTYHHLRVCADKNRLDVVQNCSSCHKCYRTTTLLVILGSLQKYKNFSQKLTPGDYFRWGFLTLLNPRHASDIRNSAFRAGKFGMVLLIQIAIILRKMKKSILYVTKSLLSRKWLYQIKRKIYNPESVHSEGDS